MGASVRYLAEHFAEVPVLVVPTVARRYGGVSTFQQASRWGSILPAVWSLHLALRSRGLGSAWTTLHLYREREAAELLGIPYGDHTQAGLFPVAYTAVPTSVPPIGAAPKRGSAGTPGRADPLSPEMR